MSVNFHQKLLQSFGAKGKVLDELLSYCRHAFEQVCSEEQGFEEPPFIKAYESYAKEAQSQGAFEVLSKHLVQLQFPIQQGISDEETYMDAVLRGKIKTVDQGLQLVSPQNIELQIYRDELIGKVPVLIVQDKGDFDAIICALTNKNEPKTIPASMGAAFIKGLNNWSRISHLRNDWMAQNPFGSWNEEFRQNILPNSALYQDQLIILSKQPYSNVEAARLNLDQELWKSYSIAIRRAHECAHIFTLQHYGKMENHIFDELVADYVGITSVLGKFELTWFLHFMGLEDLTNYRSGGRFQNYVPNLSVDAIKILQEILIQAACNLHRFDSTLGKPDNSLHRRNRIKAICETGLIHMASEYGPRFLLEKYESYEMSFATRSVG